MKLKNDIKRWKSKINQKDLKHETKKYIYDFQQYNTIRSFADNIYIDKINIDEGEMDQTNLSKNWKELSEKIDKKRNTFESVNALYEG